jgi:C-terminal processing protease CtpA/Prc
MRSDALVLGLGEHRDGVDLVLPAGGVEITGTVSDLRGGPIARAEVHASPTTSFASVDTELAVGDVITSIDGVDAGVLASETVCALFEPPPGTVLQLAVARGATVTVVAAPR